ncbi:MAG: type III pantothenate kinase [Planctomycetota bacterium]|jgi:type III pantothenate kinase
MSLSPSLPLVAADVGNHRIKLGLFEPAEGGPLPEPASSFGLFNQEPDLDRIGAWLSDAVPSGVPWWIGSVNRPIATRLIDWLHSARPEDPITLLAAGDLPLDVALERPDMVGIDRLLDAVAANHLRRPDRAAVVVDVGSAITVDLVSPQGAFLGGVIMPGIAMSARAMHAFTDLLPKIEMAELATPPPALGTSTVPAMRSGLFWGAVGGIRSPTCSSPAGPDPPWPSYWATTPSMSLISRWPESP